MSNVIQKNITGPKDIMTELITNILSPICGEDNLIIAESENDTNEVACICRLSGDDIFRYKMLETVLYCRKEQKLLKGITVELAEDCLQGFFFLKASSIEEMQSIKQSVFNNAGINDNKLFMTSQPIDTELLNFKEYCILAIDLTEQEEKAVNIAYTSKKFTGKAVKVLNSAGTSAYVTTDIIMKDIAKPLAEVTGKIGASVLGGTVNAGYAGTVTFLDEFTNTVSLTDMKNYEPAQRLTNRVMGIFKKNDDDKRGLGRIRSL